MVFHIWGFLFFPLLRTSPRTDGETLLERDTVKGGRHLTQGLNPVRKGGEKPHFQER